MLACRSITTGCMGLNRVNTTVTGTERAGLWASSPSTLVRSFFHRNSDTDSQACNTPHAKIRTWVHQASYNVQQAQLERGVQYIATVCWSVGPDKADKSNKPEFIIWHVKLTSVFVTQM